VQTSRDIEWGIQFRPIDFLDAPVNYHLVDGILDKTLLRVDRAIWHNHI
jgi:hypothetical protein